MMYFQGWPRILLPGAGDTDAKSRNIVALFMHEPGSGYIQKVFAQLS